MEPVLTFSYSDDLNNLLAQPSPALEDILDQECVAQDVKNSSNDQLITYLTQPHILEKLVSYVSEPPADSSLHLSQLYRDLKTTKFPFVACEILSSNHDIITRRFVGLPLNQDEALESNQTDNPIEHSPEPVSEEKAPILRFLKFLDSAEPIDYTLAGYFCKVLKVAFQKEFKQVGRILFESSYVKKIASHVYSDSMQDLLFTILKLDGSHLRSTPGEHYIQQRVELVEQLVSNLNQESESNGLNDMHYDRQNNSAMTLCGLLSAVACFPDGKSILSPLLSADTLYKLLQGILNPCQTKLLAPLTKQLCTYHKNIYSSSSDKFPLLDLVGFTECIHPSEIPESEPFIVAILGSLQEIVNSLDLELKANQAQINSLSFNPNQRKVSIVEVLTSFLKLQNKTVDSKFIESKGLEMLLSMFSKNPWNSILHSELVKLFTFVIKHGSSVVRQALFEQAKFLEFIIEENSIPDIDVPGKKDKKTKKSYLGYLAMLVTAVEKTKDAEVQDFVKENGEWIKYKEEVKDKKEEKTLEKEPSPKAAMPLFGLEEMTSAQEEDPDAINISTPMGGPKMSMGSGFGLSFGQSQFEEEEGEDECGWPVRDPEKTPKASKNIEWDDF